VLSGSLEEKVMMLEEEGEEEEGEEEEEEMEDERGEREREREGLYDH
jgi:hypothetical protein